MNWHLLNQQEILKVLDAKPGGLQQVNAEENYKFRALMNWLGKRKNPSG